jgi:NAD-dependent SIR2 family protein deacetylase
VTLLQDRVDFSGEIMPRRRALLTTLFASLVVAAGLPLGCTSYEHLTDVSPGDTPNPQECAACHVEITREWRRSAHASAWMSEEFAQTTHDYEVSECLGCHAPASIYENEGAPSARLERREQGVDCQACHLVEGALVGPIAETGALFEAHPVRIDKALFKSAELCGRCHEGTYAEWKRYGEEDAKACQECHMPAVRRTITQKGDVMAGVFPGLENVVDQRRHQFDLTVVSELEGAVELAISLHRRDAGVVAEVLVTNRLPHLLPTGDFGFRLARLSVVAFDAQGGEVARHEEKLLKEIGTSLVPGEERKIGATFDAEAVRVEVLLERLDAKSEGPLLIARGAAKL